MQQKKHKAYMEAALEQAQLALSKNEPPFGCVLVDKQGDICLREHDRIVELGEMSAHAETLLLKRACQKLKVKTLEGFTLYTTVEPCPMCFTTGWLNHLTAIVYGASMMEINGFTAGEQRELLISCEEMNERGGSTMDITGGVLKQDAIRIFARYDFL